MLIRGMAKTYGCEDDAQTEIATVSLWDDGIVDSGQSRQNMSLALAVASSKAQIVEKTQSNRRYGVFEKWSFYL